VLTRINNFAILSISLLITSNYYFYSARGFFFNHKVIFIQILFIFIFSIIFFYIIKKISIILKKKNNFLNNILSYFIIIWLIKETINGYFLISNTYSFGEVFVLMFQNINENEYLKLIIERSFPYIFSIFIFFFLINKPDKILRFIKITGIIFFIYFVYEFSSRYLESLKYFENQNKEKIIFESSLKNKRIVWIIFDEFDYEYAFKNNSLKNFEKLKENSVSSYISFAPGPNTKISLPSTLMNINPKGSGTSKHKYYLIDQQNKMVPFKYNNTIFKKLDSKNVKFEIMSSMLPYCSMLNINKNCTEKLTQWYRGIVYEYSIINKFFTFFDLTRNYLSNSDKKVSFEEIIAANIVEKIKDTDSIDGHKNFDYKDLRKSLESNTNFIFIHLYVPHLPAQYAMKKYNIYLNEQDHLKKYFLNLKVSDEIIKKINEILKESSRETLLILSSDHWYRLGPDRKRFKDKDKKAYPVLFISKFLNDKNSYIIDKKINLLEIHDFVLDYFDDKIRSNKEIYEFFINKEFSEPFLNTIYR